MSEFGIVEIHERGFEVRRADEKILVTLELVAKSDPRWFSVSHRDLSFAGLIYRVTGWDEQSGCLIAERQSDWP